MKAKKKFNLGFIISIVTLLILLIIYIFFSSRAALAQANLTNQVEDYQKVITNGLIVDPAEVEMINSAFNSDQDINKIILSIVEEHWLEILPQIKDFFIDEITLEQHKTAFYALLENSFQSGVYVYDIPKMKIYTTTSSWNLKNHIEISTDWEVTYHMRTSQNLFSDIYLNKADADINDYSFMPHVKTIWQQKNGTWKILKSDIIYPLEFIGDTSYAPYYY